MILNTDSSNLIVNSKPIVSTTRSIRIAGSKSNLPITITADFTDIPQEQIEIYFNAFQASYGDTTVYNNTDPEPLNIEEKKRDWKLNRILNRIWKK